MGGISFFACPFGISTSPGEYQTRMAHEVSNLNGAIVYIDDTVIYGGDVEGFLDILDRILSQIAKLNVQLNVRLKSNNFLFWNDISRIPGSQLRHQWSKIV
jgi:hypothetical protein